MKIQEQQHSQFKELAEKLESQRTAMVTLQDVEGRLSSRPLTAIEMDAQGALWFIVSRKAMAPLLPHADEPVNVAISDEGSSLYVSIAGRASLVDDLARKIQLWTMMARPWFSGADDPDLTLLRVQPLLADIWDGPDSSVVRALALVTSVAAAKPIGLGSHETVKAGPTAVPHT